jgi:hypothetical protein
MSTLKADTIVASDGSSPVALTKQQATKGHYSYNQGTNTLATETFNVSSATDEATGKHYVSYTNAMAQANHPVTFLADASNFLFDEGETARTASRTGTMLTYNAAHNTLLDVQFNGGAFHGGLA